MFTKRAISLLISIAIMCLPLSAFAGGAEPTPTTTTHQFSETSESPYEGTGTSTVEIQMGIAATMIDLETTISPVFAINPNENAGSRFVADPFVIQNHGVTHIQVSVKKFAAAGGQDAPFQTDVYPNGNAKWGNYDNGANNLFGYKNDGEVDTNGWDKLTTEKSMENIALGIKRGSSGWNDAHTILANLNSTYSSKDYADSTNSSYEITSGDFTDIDSVDDILWAATTKEDNFPSDGVVIGEIGPKNNLTPTEAQLEFVAYHGLALDARDAAATHELILVYSLVGIPTAATP